MWKHIQVLEIAELYRSVAPVTYGFIRCVVSVTFFDFFINITANIHGVIVKAEFQKMLGVSTVLDPSDAHAAGGLKKAFFLSVSVSIVDVLCIYRAV